MTELAVKILSLKASGDSYRKIALKLNCSPSTIAYYLCKGKKERCVINNKNRRHKHPYITKLESFKQNNKKNKYINKHISTNRSLLYKKLQNFCRNNPMDKNNITIDNIIQRFGENPKCYLTGELIDIYQPRTYHFDHIIPRSRGGQNTLDNLGICTKRANKSKDDMTPDEFINLCKIILEYNGYKIEKSQD